MAKQDPRPTSWHERLSDGCTAVLDFTWVNKWIRMACLIHDCDCHWGGATSGMKLRADRRFRGNTAKGGWLGRRLAPGRYWGVRRFCFNTPPKKGSLAGPAERRYYTMWEAIKHGQTRVDLWNWAGPGRGEHANMEAQGSKDSPHLLPEQSSSVAAAREVA